MTLQLCATHRIVRLRSPVCWCRASSASVDSSSSLAEPAYKLQQTEDIGGLPSSHINVDRRHVISPPRCKGAHSGSHGVRGRATRGSNGPLRGTRSGIMGCTHYMRKLVRFFDAFSATATGRTASSLILGCCLPSASTVSPYALHAGQEQGVPCRVDENQVKSA